jgi:hypothetical protein
MGPVAGASRHVSIACDPSIMVHDHWIAAAQASSQRLDIPSLTSIRATAQGKRKSHLQDVMGEDREQVVVRILDPVGVFAARV